MTKGKFRPKVGLHRTVKCAIPSLPVDVTKDFEKEMTTKGFPWTVKQVARNGKIYEVTIPEKYADIFATYVNSNFGDML